MNKRALFENGSDLMTKFCSLNSIERPAIVETEEPRRYRTCAFYRHSEIKISVPACAAIGTAAMAWSFPGYTVDRTPYGVLQHELGHHVDVTRSTRKGNYHGDFGMRVREVTGEEKITSYCPDDAEWFAEMFRLFVTNPDLLKLLRPRTHRELASCFKPVFDDTWQSRLVGAPDRTIAAAKKKIDAAAARSIEQPSLI